MSHAPYPTQAYTGAPPHQQPPPQIVMAAPPPTVIVQQPQISSNRVYTNYRAKAAKALGSIMIAAGIVSFGLNVAAIAIIDEHGWSDDWWAMNPLYNRGYGIWCGLMYIICGGFTIGAAKHKSHCMIVTSTVLCIIMAINSWQHIGFAATTVGVDGARHADLTNNPFRYWLPSAGYDKFALDLSLAFGVVLLVLGLLEFIVLVWASTLGCKLLCCQRRNTTQTQHVQYVTTPAYVGKPLEGPQAVTAVPGQPNPYGHGAPYNAYAAQGAVATAPPSYDATMNVNKV